MEATALCTSHGGGDPPPSVLTSEMFPLVSLLPSGLFSNPEPPSLPNPVPKNRRPPTWAKKREAKRPAPQSLGLSGLLGSAGFGFCSKGDLEPVTAFKSVYVCVTWSDLHF